MPYVRGFLKLGRRNRPGRPDIGLPDVEGPVDPDYGIEEGGDIDNELPELPSPPPGIWPPLTPENPWRPVDPGWGQGRPLPPVVGGGPARPPVTPESPEVEPPITLPPGSIWPPLPPDVHGKFLALVLVGGMGHGVKYRYVVIDADAKPPHRPGRPEHPIAPGGPDTLQPKR